MTAKTISVIGNDGENKLNGLHKNTIGFITDIKKKFGTSIVDRKDPVLKDIIFKNQMASFNSVIRNLETKGVVSILWNEAGKIDSFQLLN